ADSLALIGAVVLASLIKPINLTFLTIAAYAPGGLARRWPVLALATGLCAGLALSPLPGVAEWRALVVGVAVDPDPGGGFMRRVGDLGLKDHLAVTAAYGLYGLALFASGFVIVVKGGLDAKARTWLGAAVAVLLLPRMVAYDILILGPGLLAAVAAAR